MVALVTSGGPIALAFTVRESFPVIQLDDRICPCEGDACPAVGAPRSGFLGDLDSDCIVDVTDLLSVNSMFNVRQATGVNGC
jgi:hypothetical protein